MSLKRLALGALLLTLGVMIPIQTKAGDLGGPAAVADLEERIGELEATVPRKGNRRVSLQISGSVHKSILFHDADIPGIADRSVGDGSQHPSTLSFMGEAKASPNVSVGFRLEFGVDDNAVVAAGQEKIVIRHSAVWVQSLQLGRLTVGHTSQSTDGIVEISIANADVASKMLNLEPFSSQYMFGAFNLPFDGGRRDVVRWDSPSIGGFTLSASYAQGDRIGPVTLTDGDVWDIAARWAGEFGGFRAAAGVGYRFDDHNAAGPLLGATADSVLSGSASIKHLASGLFVNAAAGQVKDFGGVGGPMLKGYHGQGGWENNVFGIGNTTLFAGYAFLDAEGSSTQPKMLEAGIVQAIDNAALDLYASWRQYDLDAGDPKINAFMLGARVRF